MARYYGTVQGARGIASRLGSKESGIVSVTNGWNIGARVEVEYRNGEDFVSVWITGGSCGGGREELVWSGPKADAKFENMGNSAKEHNDILR